MHVPPFKQRFGRQLSVVCSHRVPRKPGRQRQKKELLGASSHVPPFLQGALAHIDFSFSFYD